MAVFDALVVQRVALAFEAVFITWNDQIAGGENRDEMKFLQHIKPTVGISIVQIHIILQWSWYGH